MHKRLKVTSLKSKACVLTAVATLVGLAMPVAHSAESWFLMSRSGQCMEMGALFAKMPDLASIKTPQDYIATMEKKGNQLESTVTEDAKGKTHRIRVESKGLTLTFVESGVCPL